MSKNKFIISLSITFALTFTGMQCLATTGTINTETVRMRSKASTDASVITLISLNENVEIIEKSGDWYKVKYDGKDGYIYAQYVTSKDDKNNENTNNNLSEISNKEDNESSSKQTDEQEKKLTEIDEENEDINSSNNNSQSLPINSKVIVKEEIQIKLIPLIYSNIIEIVPANTEILILDYINGWYYILTSENEGWVREEKINKDNEVKSDALNNEDENENINQESEESNKQVETEEKEVVKEENKENETETTKYVNVEKVNIRKEANTSSEILKKINKNTKVTVYCTSNGWSKVKVDNTEGYISSEYLSDEKVKEEEKTTNTTTNTTTNRSLEESRTEVTSEKTESNGNTDVVSYAKTYLGKAYVSGGTGPTAFDCSGFTRYIYKNYGVNLVHSASAQASAGTEVDKSNLQPGDIVVFNNNSNTSIGHVGIYIGENQFIHASNPTGGVKITSMSDSYYSTRYVTSRRVL